MIRSHPHVTMVCSGRPSGRRSRPSVLDLAPGHIYVPRFFFFRRALDAHALRDSLSRVLEHYPELAGRLVRDHERQCLLACSDAGVRFETVSRRGPMPTYGPDHTARPDLEHYLDTPRFASPGRDQPLMLVRVTRFDDGGCVLGISTCHTLVDGTAFYGFMRAWQAEHRGDAYPLPTQPRSRVDALGDSAADAETSPHFEVRGRVGFARFVARYLRTQRRLRALVVRYPAERLATMKEEAMAPLVGSGRWVSTNDVLSAHLWKALVAARPGPSSRAETLVALQSMRHLYDPPFEPHFMGNLVGTASLDRTSDAIHAASISELATDLREGFGHNDGAEMSRSIGFLNGQRRRGRLSRTLPRPILGLFRGSHVMINDWSRFPIYEIDFGAGRPVWFEFPIVPMPWIAILAPTPRDRGARDVHLTVPRESVGALEQRLSTNP